ncbi:MAG TPA: zf-HC2 domain-containing protein [Trebonia sp.]|nr:zf-HC2 domain-containing protein [Trebonia sp.]
MTETWDCQEARIALGVYVLGAIDPAERARVDAHLATCEACRAELDEFAGLPGMLALVPAGEAIALAEGLSADDLFPGGDFSGDDFPGGDFPSDDLFAGPSELPLPPLAALPPLAGLPALAEPPLAGPPPASPSLSPPARPAEAGQQGLAQVHDLSSARRRRQRLAWVGVAAAVVLIGGAFFGGTKLSGSAAPQGGLAAQHPNGSAAGALLTVHGTNGPDSATVAYQAMGWGIQMDALVTGIPVHTRCQMFVVENNGTRVQVGGWQTDSAEGTVWYPASTSLPVSSIKNFVITIDGGSPITVMPA